MLILMSIEDKGGGGMNEDYGMNGNKHLEKPDGGRLRSKKDTQPQEFPELCLRHYVNSCKFFEAFFTSNAW